MAETFSLISIIVSVLAFAISATTLWLTLLRKGAVRMTQPTLVFFGPDGIGGPPKVFIRTLLYCTAQRGRIVDNMFLKVNRGESVQTFSIWICGEESLGRGSGVYVGESGVTYNHHFVLPKDGTSYDFLPGDYKVEIFASLVGISKPISLSQVRLVLNESLATIMKEKGAGIFFDWGPDSGKYHAHVDEPPKRLMMS